MKKVHFLFAFLISAFAYAQKPIFVAAKVKAATVYFNSAEISQTISAILPKGTSEIVIKNVSNALNENTIQIGAPSTVTVLSVQFTDDYVSEYELDATNPAIKKVHDSIVLIKKEIQKVENARDSEAKAIELLDKNQQISGVNSGLNVAELMKMVEFYKLKRTEVNNNYDDLDEKSIKLNALLVKLNSKLEINTKKEDKTSDGKLIIQVMNEVAGHVDFEINYLTSDASWKPFYDLRANSIGEPMEMMYKAEVKQDTGIDWKKIKLTLSSGNPNQNNQAPTVNPWFLRYQQQQIYDADKESESKLEEVVVVGYGTQKKKELAGASPGIKIRGASSIDKNAQPLVVINGVPSTQEAMNELSPESIKSVNVLKDAAAKSIYGSRASNGVILVTTKQMDDYTSINENQLNISFDIDIPYDILSNGKAHSVALKEIKIPASFKYYAAPRFEKEAFLMAEIVDYSKYNLLKGEANIIFEGMYVGKTTINPSQTSDTLNLSMGRDKKISIKREKVADKSGTKFLSSKKEQTFTYDITVRNNKKETAKLLLKDQYPLSSDKEIEIELLQSDGAKVNAETGILTWDLDLKPNETKKIRISYRVKYPKDKVIDNL
jgi:TonB-dependent SusC/RagA subfamily outer membrane receptor